MGDVEKPLRRYRHDGVGVRLDDGMIEQKFTNHLTAVATIGRGALMKGTAYTGLKIRGVVASGAETGAEVETSERGNVRNPALVCGTLC